MCGIISACCSAICSCIGGCCSYCCGLFCCSTDDSPEGLRRIESGEDDTRYRKCSISWCAILAAGYAGAIMWMYRMRLATIIPMEDDYICTISYDSGVDLDESAHIMTLFKSNYYLYMGLLIACVFSCCGGPIPLCRMCSGSCHCLGFFAHIAILAYTGVIRFNYAKECFDEEDNAFVTRVDRMVEDGAFIRQMFII